MPATAEEEALVEAKKTPCVNEKELPVATTGAPVEFEATIDCLLLRRNIPSAINDKVLPTPVEEEAAIEADALVDVDEK